MRQILTLIIFTIFCFGEKVVITKDKTSWHQPDFPKPNLTLKLITSKGIETVPVQKFPNFKMYKNFEPPKPKKGRQTLNILVLKVEFVEDTDSLSTGNGKMDLIGLGKPEDGLFYDPPHTRKYFEHQMQFLSNFYKVNSFGNCVVNWTVKPDRPTDNYQLPHKMAYYSGYDHYDPSTGLVYFNTYAMEMGMVRIVADAIAAADLDETIDFSLYDNILVFHAGTLLQTSFSFIRFFDIPSATIPPGAFEYYLGVPYFVVDGGTDTVECAITCLSEMARVNYYMVGNMGTIAHEFGHILGLPDLYDVTGWSNGVGAWDLMCTGGWTGYPDAGAPYGAIPSNFSAWTRYSFGRYFGSQPWVDPLVVTNPESLLTLRASEIDTTQYGVASQTMIKVPISGTEFFLIENRQQDIKHKDTIIVDVEDGVPVNVDQGEYDFFLPGSGILIWHIDDNVINANYAYNEIQINPEHKGVDLEEADGIQHFDAWWYADSLEYYGSCYDAFFVDDSGKSRHHFGPFANPNSDSYFGKSLTNVAIKSKLDTLMNFSLSFDIYQTGFPVTVRQNNPILATTYGDLDGNGDREVVTITKTGFIYVYNYDGSLDTSRFFGTITSFPAIGDINGDSAEDIIFGANFNLWCLDGRTLNSLPNFPFKTDDVILGAPVLFDINGDNKLEIIFGSKDRKLYCLNDTGINITNFPIYLNTWIVSTPCVFDVNTRKIGVLGSDGRFWLIDANGVVKEFLNSQHNMISYSSPVVGDMDRDGDLEAVIINGYGTVYVYGEDTLEEKFESLIDTTFYYTPGLADIDKDGYLEIISPNSSKTLFVFNRNGTSENNFPLDTKEYIYYPLLIADFDAVDNKEEIVYGLGPADSISSGQLKIINNRNREFEYSPLFGEGGFSSPGVIFDLDLDGDLELACGSDSGKLYIWDFPGKNASWKGYMNSPKNWGRFEGELAVVNTPPRLLGSFYIYPSPVEKTGRVRFYLHQNAEVRVDILSIAGHKIGGIKLNKPTANEYNEVEFDFSKQSNGVYLVRLEAKNGDKHEVKFKKFAVLK